LDRSDPITHGGTERPESALLGRSHARPERPLRVPENSRPLRELTGAGSDLTLVPKAVSEPAPSGEFKEPAPRSERAPGRGLGHLPGMVQLYAQLSSVPPTAGQ